MGEVFSIKRQLSPSFSTTSFPIKAKNRFTSQCRNINPYEVKLNR